MILEYASYDNLIEKYKIKKNRRNVPKIYFIFDIINK